MGEKTASFKRIEDFFILEKEKWWFGLDKIYLDGLGWNER